MSEAAAQIQNAAALRLTAPSIFFLALAPAIASSYWAVPIFKAPDKSPDGMVLDKDALRAYVHPERGDRFHLAWSNGTLELWTPNGPATATQVMAAGLTRMLSIEDARKLRRTHSQVTVDVGFR